MHLKGEIIACASVEGKGKRVARVPLLSVSSAGSFIIAVSHVSWQRHSEWLLWCGVEQRRQLLSADLCNLHLETIYSEG